MIYLDDDPYKNNYDFEYWSLQNYTIGRLWTGGLSDLDYDIFNFTPMILDVVCLLFLLLFAL